MTNSERPDPDKLLERIRSDEAQLHRGKLKIFLGMCAGVGKTYSMLQSAQDAKRRGSSVLVGYVETHGRSETQALLTGLTLLPRKQISYKDRPFEDFDLDAALAAKPDIVLVDELAHSNITGMRHEKRFQDVLELLDQGISVFTTLNVQHLESLKDTVSQITGIPIHETVPDTLIDRCDEIELVDLSVQDMLQRLSEGKVYVPDRAQAAIANFFSQSNLIALRELALRIAAQRVDKQLTGDMSLRGVEGPWKAGERLMVAVGPSPYSEQLIRWTRRIADTMKAPWIAVNVLRPGHEPDVKTQDLLRKNITLAQELGAELVTTTDNDIAHALTTIARQRNVTQIVIGKSVTHPLYDLLTGGTLVSRLIRQSGGIDIYVVQSGFGKGSPRRRTWLPEGPTRLDPVQYVLAAGSVALVAAGCSLLRSIIDYRSVGMFLLFAVSMLAMFVRRGPVLLAAALGAFLWDFIFIPPVFTLTIGSMNDMLLFAMYFVIALIGGTLTSRIRRNESTIRQRENDTGFLYAYLGKVAHADTTGAIVAISVSEIERHFGAETAVVLLDGASGRLGDLHNASTLTSMTPKDRAVAEWSFANRKEAGRGTKTLALEPFTFYPLMGSKDIVGVVGINRGSKPPLALEQERLLRMLLQQFALNLEREYLHTMAEHAHVLEKSENLYKTLLSSISHELRTPIVTIKGAATGILEEKTGSDRVKRVTLAGDICTAAERLDDLVKNLLDMTRIDSGLLKPRIDWCNLHELVDLVMADVRPQAADHLLSSELPSDLPLVRVDEVLMRQAILNIVRNCLAYTPAGAAVTIRARMGESDIEILIEDNGPGFQADILPYVFDKFFRGPHARTPGSGLGLSITRGFIEANGGTITAENRSEGGARFTLRLPIGAPARE